MKPIPNEIFRQLGGNRFAFMVGLKNLSYNDSAIYFDIGRGAKNGINMVKIELTPMDDYTVTFYRKWGMKFSVIKEFRGIYCDNLVEIFEGNTGFFTKIS